MGFCQSLGVLQSLVMHKYEKNHEKTAFFPKFPEWNKLLKNVMKVIFT